MRRAGWNVLTFTYRGAWGSEGDFSISNALEDARAALDFLRSEAAVRDHGIDPSRIVIAGHSMGGYAAAATAANDLIPDDGQTKMSASGEVALGPGHRQLAGVILLDAWNIASDAGRPRAALIAGMNDFGHALHGGDAGKRGRRGHRTRTRLEPPRAGTDAGTGARADDLRDPWRGRGQSGDGGGAEARWAAVTAREIDSDHPFADHRIAPAVEVVRWLQALPHR